MRGMTPPEVARRYRVSADKVLTWIRSGELAAVNIATRTGGRPRWLIRPEDLAAFERRRAAVPAVRATRSRRAKPAGVVEYF